MKRWKFFWWGVILAFGVNLYASEPAAPTISKALVSQRVPVYGDVTLDAQVSGAEPLSYQWFFNGEAVIEATNRQLILTNLAYQHTGDYAVVVTNEVGTITNGPARLTVAEVFVWGSPNAYIPNIPDSATNVVQLSTGSGHALALRADGMVVGWGIPGWTTAPKTNAPSDATNVVRIFAADESSMGINADGRPLIWGILTSSPLWGIPIHAYSALDVAAGRSFAGVLKQDGELYLWGGNMFRPTVDKMPYHATKGMRLIAGPAQFSNRDEFTLLRRDGRLVNWLLESGQTNWLTSMVAHPTNIANIVAVDMQDRSYIALKGDGRVATWGITNGQSLPIPPTIPVEATNIVSVSALAGGEFLALRNDGRLIVWGRRNITTPTNLVDIGLISGGNLYSVTAVSDGKLRFTDHLGDLIAYQGENYSLNALVVGKPPLTYQWKLNGEDIPGAINPILTITNIQDSAEGVYSVTVSNPLGTLAGEVANLTVDPPLLAPVILTQPENVAATAGDELLLSVDAVGSPALEYQWQFNGQNLMAATNASYYIPSVHTNRVGSYRVVIRNFAGSITSQVASVTVDIPPQPAFISWPVNQTPVIGGSVSLTAPVTGDEPRSYRWQINGMDIPGATGPVLGLNGVSTMDSGTYRLIVSNAFGVAVSPEFTLTVLPVVAWGLNDVGQTNLPTVLTNAIAVSAGYRHALALLADGTVVAWGTNDLGQLDVPADLTNAVAIASGNYHNLALRADGTVVGWGFDYYGESSGAAGITNIIAISAGSGYSMALRADGTVVTWGSRSMIAPIVTNDSSSFVALSAGILSAMGLRADGTVSSWSAMNGLNFTTTPGSGKKYSTIGAGWAYGMAIDQYLQVTVWSAPSFNYPRQSPSGQPGGYLGMGLSGPQVIALATGMQHIVAVDRQGKLLTYGGDSVSFNDVRLSKPSTTKMYSQIAVGENFSLGLLEDDGPRLTPQVSERTAFEGGTAVFNARAAGEPLATYQWEFEGAALPGQTNFFLTLNNVRLDQAGDYRVVKTHFGGSAYGMVTGAVTRLNVVPPPLPEIGLQPVSQILPVGTNATFTTGLAPGSIGWPQWQFNGADMVGATNLSLTLTNILSVNEGEYRVIFSNASGAVTSQVAVLTLSPTAPYIVVQPRDTMTVPDGVAMFQVQAYGSEPLTYRWYFNGELLADANTSVLALTGISMEKLGHYSVSISNALGVVTSREAILGFTTVAAFGANKNGQAELPVAASNLVSVAVGTSHVLGLRDDGQVVFWGDNACTNAAVPIAASNIVRIAAGGTHSLALRADGKVFGWGTTTVPEGLHDVTEISAGLYHSLALRLDGSVVAWGRNNNRGQTNVPVGLTDVIAIASGAAHNLALKRDGSVVAWGNLNTVPTEATNVVAIAAGLNYSVVLKNDGSLVAWGRLASTNSPTPSATCSNINTAGILTGLTNRIEVPVEATNIVSIAAGRDHILALRADGQIIAWGANDYGQLDIVSADNVYGIAAGENLSFTFRGNRAPALGYWETNRTQMVGTALLLNTVIAGSGPQTYQWMFNNEPLVGATNDFYYQPETYITNAGDYSVVITNFSGSITAAVSLNFTSGPPVFVQHPTAEQTVGLGDTVTYTAKAIGSFPIHYQWQRDGTNLTDNANVQGSQTATLTLTGVTPADSGNYRAIASNDQGQQGASQAGMLTALSRGLLEEALDGPGLVWRTGGPSGWHWQNETTHDGVDAAMTGPHLEDQTNWVETTVVGPTTIHFWWMYVGWISEKVAFSIDGVDIIALSSDFGWQAVSHDIPAGEHTLRWTLEAEPFPDASSLWLDQVILGAPVPPTIATQPANRTATAGSSPNLTVTASGTRPFRYQWQYAGQDILGATNSMLTLTNIQLEQAGEYKVMVLNSGGQILSQGATVQVTGAPPVGQVLPVSVTAALGTSLSLTGIVSGQLPIHAQWQRNRADLPGENGTVLSIPNIQPEHAGDYRLVLSNQFGTTFTAEVPLTIVPVVAWGQNGSWQLIVPADVGDVVQVAGGYYQSAALRRDGTITTWGERMFSTIPVYPLPAHERLVAFAMGGYIATDHFVGLRADGTVVNWGPSMGIQPDGLSNVVAVAAGPGHDLALKADGTVLGWGSNTAGKATPPSQATNMVAISAGGFFSFGLNADGTVMGWGTNFNGVLDFPAELTNVVAISAGYSHGLALREDGAVVTWGNHTNQVMPDGLSNIVAVAAGHYHNVALKKDGTVVTWGSTNPVVNYVWPTLTNVTSIAAGANHSLAIVGDGSPHITVQPWLRATSETGQPKLQVMAVGGGELNYQWQHNGEDVAGATAVTLFLSATNLPGNYRVVVSNTLGTVTSRVVAYAGPPPVLAFEAISMEADGLHLRLSGFSGQRNIVIYSSTDLVNWQPVQTNAPTTGVIEFVDEDVSAAARFYQAVEE